MLKNYRDFLLEFDLGLDDIGGSDKEKKEEPDPEKEIEKEKRKRRREAKKERNEKIAAAKDKIKKYIEETPQQFRNDFEKEIADALKADDRVIYHTLILKIQRWQMPKASEQDEESVVSTGPIIKVIQDLNKKEYLG